MKCRCMPCCHLPNSFASFASRCTTRQKRCKVWSRMLVFSYSLRLLDLQHSQSEKSLAKNWLQVLRHGSWVRVMIRVRRRRLFHAWEAWIDSLSSEHYSDGYCSTVVKRNTIIIRDQCHALPDLAVRSLGVGVNLKQQVLVFHSSSGFKANKSWLLIEEPMHGIIAKDDAVKSNACD